MLARVSGNAGRTGSQPLLVWAVVAVTVVSGISAWVRLGAATAVAMLLLALVVGALLRVAVSHRRA